MKEHLYRILNQPNIQIRQSLFQEIVGNDLITRYDKNNHKSFNPTSYLNSLNIHFPEHIIGFKYNKQMQFILKQFKENKFSEYLNKIDQLQKLAIIINKVKENMHQDKFRSNISNDCWYTNSQFMSLLDALEYCPKIEQIKNTYSGKRNILKTEADIILKQLNQ